MHQLLVSHPEELPAAIEKIESCGSNGLDLNMGCTAALVIKRGGGITLMKDVRRAEAIVKASRRATNLPLTAKIRLGWTPRWGALREFCLMLQDNGLDAISVHPRLKQDRFKRPARWEYIAKVKNLLDIPVIGNGDVDSPDAALRMFRETGCDAIMIGRAAVRQPWIFRQVAASLSRLPSHHSPPNPPEIYKRYVSLLSASVGAEYALPLLRNFTFYFARNYAFGHTLWRLVQNANSVPAALAHADVFFKTQRAKPG